MADTLSDLRRLRRAREGRVVAGVCAGLGVQLRVDPVLLRVVIAVLSIFGVGLVLYAAGWLLLPVADGKESKLEQHLGRRSDGTPDRPLFIAGVVVLLAVVASMPWWGLPWHGPALFILAIAGLIALVKRGADGLDADAVQDDGAPPSITSWSAASSSAEGLTGTTTSASVPPANATGQGAIATGGLARTGPPTAESTSSSTNLPSTASLARFDIADDDETSEIPAETSWRSFSPAPESFWEQSDPLGLHDDLDVLPVDATLPPGEVVDTSFLSTPGSRTMQVGPERVKRPKRPKPALFIVTLSAIAITQGALGLSEAGYGVPPSAYIAAALGVTGLGLIAGTWFGRSRALIALGVVLSIALLPTAALDDYLPFRVADDIKVMPTSVSQIRSTYEYSVGELHMNLTKVPFTDESNVTTTIKFGAGDVSIIVPPNVDVTVDSELGVGDAKIFSKVTSGPGLDGHVTDLGADGEGGGQLHLTIDQGTGDLKVHRG